MDKAMPVSLLDPLRDSAGRRLFTDHDVETLREIFRHNAEHTRFPRKEESR
jgi:DNA-binding transcriptional MerR regulator